MPLPFSPILALLAALALAQPASKQAAKAQGAPLIEVYSDNDFQLTGVTVSKSGRVFVNFPRWSDKYQNAVMEVMADKSAKPYPDQYWNRWDKQPATASKQFVCVQSVVVDDTDALWILDPAMPLLATVVPNGPKLVKVDLNTNRVTRVIPFGPDIAKPKTYLNDIRFDTKRNIAYMTDSGVGGLIVLDLSTGKARRLLDGHPSVMAEPGVEITINAKLVVGPDGKPPTFHADSIALSPDGQYLYYKPLTAKTLYRIRTAILRDASATPKAVAAAVDNLGATFPTDGFWMDANQRLYLSAIEQNAVIRRMPDGSMQTVAADPRLQWPDTFSEGPDGAIYITTSHIHESPTYNQGQSTRKLPYSVFKFKP